MLINGIDILGIVFELTLFCLLSIFVYRLIKDYLSPMLHSEIGKIKKNKHDIKEKENLLVDSKKRIKNQIKAQEEKFVLLEKKVQLWKASVSAIAKEKKQQAVLLFDQIKAKRTVQETNLNMLKLQALVIPKSIKLAYQKIDSMYGNQKSEGLLKELISSIK